MKFCDKVLGASLKVRRTHLLAYSDLFPFIVITLQEIASMLHWYDACTALTDLRLSRKSEVDSGG